MGVKKVLGIVFMFIGVFSTVIFLTQHEFTGDRIAQVAICGGIGLLLFFTKSKTKAEKLAKKAQKQELTEKMKSTIYCKHIDGLPLAQDVGCDIFYSENEFVFSGGGNTFNLKFDKLTDLTVKTNIEVQQQYVSSIGGAIGGAVLFGPLGAIIGGRAKKKKTSEITYFLIFTYLKEGTISYISFEIFDFFKAKSWVGEIKSRNSLNGINVEL